MLLAKSLASLPSDFHFCLRDSSLTPQNILCSFCCRSPTFIYLNSGSLVYNPHTDFLKLFQSFQLLADLSPFLSSDPFEIQISAGCEVLSGNSSESFLHSAFQGTDIMSFQGTSWVSAPDAPPWMQRVCRVLNEDQGTKETVQWLLYDICPQFVRGVLETGKSELEKQVKPEAWLSSGPTPGPGRLLLVCHVSGFYPKPVWVMWMRGEQEQPGTQQGDILPHADGTWYLRVTLDVAAGEASGLSCRVKHSSLGDQDIILYWDHSHVLVIVLSVLAFILVLGGSFAFWFRRRRVYQNIQ